MFENKDISFHYGISETVLKRIVDCYVNGETKYTSTKNGAFSGDTYTIKPIFNDNHIVRGDKIICLEYAVDYRNMQYVFHMAEDENVLLKNVQTSLYYANKINKSDDCIKQCFVRTK